MRNGNSTGLRSWRSTAMTRAKKRISTSAMRNISMFNDEALADREEALARVAEEGLPSSAGG